LASSLDRRDEIPNQELAAKIVSSKDSAAVLELIALLDSKKKDIQNDSIKVLYEIGALKPALIAEHIPVFLKLLTSKNNRLQWGAMAALESVTAEKPEQIYESLPEIADAADKGSVITKDGAVNIFIKLCETPDFAEDSFPLLIEQLKKSPTNQLPMYAERALPIINNKNRLLFTTTLSTRLNEIEKESKRKRMEKVIQKATKI
uniref:hypothetical protein n=1 Tax=Fluviicola sp. TaxID=1917219 RepID=UPI00262D5584